jgi:hypothetical protein
VLQQAYTEMYPEEHPGAYRSIGKYNQKFSYIWATPSRAPIGKEVNSTSKKQKESVFTNGVKKADAAVTAFAEVVMIYLREKLEGGSQIQDKLVRRLSLDICKMFYKCLKYAMEDCMEKRLKEEFMLLHALAMGKRSQLSYHTIQGALKQFLNRIAARANQGRKKSIFWIRTFYETKRCWLAVSDKFEEQAMHDHEEIMTDKAITKSPVMLSALRRTVQMLFKGRRYKPGPMTPTYSATFDIAKRDGGSHQKLCSELAELGYSRPYLGFAADMENLEDGLETYCLLRSYNETNAVKYQAISEPGKIRVITAGETHLYTGLRRFQGFLLSTWSDLPFSTFCDNTDLRIQKRLYSNYPLAEDELFISGDYSSATDALHMDATETVIDEIFNCVEGIPDLLKERIKFSFSGANIHYPRRETMPCPCKQGLAEPCSTHGNKCVDTETLVYDRVVKQVRGQLMGHPLSFPILCIINLATYVATKNIYRYDQLKDAALLVNGDDILFRGTEDDYVLWRLWCSKVGLRVNESKTYTHKKWSLINSILSGPGSKVGYFNLALATGHKVKSEPVRTVGQVRRLWDELECLSPIATKVGRRYLMNGTLKKKLRGLSLYDKRTKKTIFTPNWFLPFSVGGLGLSTDRPFKVTQSQRIIGTFFARNPSKKWLNEKLSHLPGPAKNAIRLVADKLLPSVEAWVDSNGRPFHGPLNYHDDFEHHADIYFKRALKCTKFDVSDPKIFGDRPDVCRGKNLWQIFSRERKEKMISVRKLKRFAPRFRILDVLRARNQEYFSPSIPSKEDIESIETLYGRIQLSYNRICGRITRDTL